MSAVSIEQAMQMAIEHQQAGRLAEAEAIYRQVIGHDPNHAQALHLLGTLAYQLDAYEPAAELIRRAITIRGEWPEACYHLGLALQADQQFEPAIAAHRRAVSVDPGLAAAHYNLGVCLQVIGQRDRAIAAYEQAIAIQDDDVYVCSNLGLALQGAGRLDEAIAMHRRAIRAKPDLADAQFNLGTRLRESDRIEEAITAFARAVELNPNEPRGFAQLTGALRELGRIDEAIAVQGQAVKLLGDDPEAHYTYAVMLLSSGEWARGWAEFEWRWRRRRPPWPLRKFAQPRWNGSDIAGRTILVHAEKSVGDTIQFLRYVPILLARGARVVVECQPALRRLVSENLAVDRVFSPGDPLPSFDVYCPLMSLPGIFGTTPQSIPAMPIWHAPADAVALWMNKVTADRDHLKVGVAWAGSPSEIADAQRSVTLAMLAPLAQSQRVTFFCLQRGQAAAQARSVPAGMTLMDWSADLTDFAETAALIAQLDLVISVDTGVAHLAATMGKPVWTMLPFNADWRWLRGGDATPWYPSMRLFRQSSRGDWASVIDRVADALSNSVVGVAGGRS